MFTASVLLPTHSSGKFTKKTPYINKKASKLFEFQGLCYFVRTTQLFFVAACSVLVTVQELIYATSSVNQFSFASVERVRRT